VEGLNEALLAKAAEAKLLRCTRVRVDTTVVPSNVAYPTDAGLLAKAVGRIAATGRRIQAAGGATRTQLRDRSRAAGKRAHAIASKLRSRVAVGRDEAPAAVKKANAELADLAETDAEEPVGCWPTRNGRRGKPEPWRNSTAGRTRSRVGVGVAWPGAVNDLEGLLEATRRIAAQARQRLAGVTPDGSTRRVSLHGPDAGRSRRAGSASRSSSATRPKLFTTTTVSSSTTTCSPATPADAPRMEPAIKRVARRTGRKPRTVAADRGYGEAGVDDALHNLGVRDVVLPRKGRLTKARQAEEHRRAFRRHLKWRTGCEGRISSLKRGSGWDRSRIDATEGATIWAGHGVLTHNLVKISALAS